MKAALQERLVDAADRVSGAADHGVGDLVLDMT